MHQSISTILLAPPAEQQLHALARPLQKLLVKWLHTLRTNPRPSGSAKLNGLDHLYRVREGDYRIVYAIRDRDLLVLAIKNSARTDATRS